MFEFLKKLNEKLSNNVLKLDKNTGEKGVSYVMDKKLRKEINDWLKDRFKSCKDISFDVIVDNFFVFDKTLNFKKDDKDCGIGLYYSYDGNNFGNDKIELSTEMSLFNEVEEDSCKVILSGKDYKKVYCFAYVNGNFVKVLENDMSIQNIDGKIYFRRIEPYGFNIIIKNCCYDEVILNCSGNRDIDISNEDKLKEYLLTIDMDTLVREIYDKIREISLKDEKKLTKIDLILKKDGKEVSKLYIDMGRSLSLYGPTYQYEVIDNGKRLYYQYYEPKSSYQINTRNGFSEDDGLIELKNGDYGIVIKFPYFKGCYNEKLIRDYLINLEFPVKIDEVYKKLCKVYENIYRVSIEITYKKKTTDLIKINGKKLVSFKTMKDGKDITLDKDGNFYYVSKNGKKELTVNIIDDIVTKCDYSSLEGIENDNMGNSIYNGINEAKDEKVRVRKMLDEMLKKDNN